MTHFPLGRVKSPGFSEMAPRRRHPKVGLTRMHAALDAMRPMGFSSDTVRKCVKNLLKVYGDDGWAFIEESAYKLLIDTILEEPVVSQHECEPQGLPAEGGSQGAHKLLESVLELSDKGPTNSVHEPETDCDDIGIEQEESLKKEVLGIVKEEPVLMQYVRSPPEVGVQLGSPLACTPKTSSSNLKSRVSTPCFGWISDDEDDEFLQLTPAAKGLGK